MKKNKRNTFFIKLLVFLNSLSISALLFSYFSGTISPSKVTFLAYFGLGYIIIVLINLLFAVLWAFIRYKFALINLIIILLGWNLFWGHVNLRLFNPTTKALTINIISYNTHNYLLHHPDSSKYRNYRQVIVDYIKAGNFEIACFQEFFTTNNKDSILNDSIIKTLNYPYYFYATYQKPQKSQCMDAIAIFSNFPIIKRAILTNTQNENFSIYTDLIIHGDTNRLFNIHLTSIRLGNYKDSIQGKSVYKIGKAFKLRSEEIDFLKNEIDKSPYPVIICGDFNDTPASYAYQQLIKGLDDTYSASATNIGNTYFWNTPPIRIDHILINKKYKSFYYEVKKLPFSDHYPVVAKIISNNN